MKSLGRKALEQKYRIAFKAISAVSDEKVTKNVEVKNLEKSSNESPE